MMAGRNKKITVIAAITALLSATAAFITIRRVRAADRTKGDLNRERNVEIETKLAKVEIMVEKEAEPKPKVIILDQGIQELNLSVRVYNALKLAGVNTVEDLTLKTEEDVSEIRNLGSKSIEEVDLKLAKIGYALRPDEEEI